MIVESVACSVDDCLAAQDAGVGRIELVQAIELGGLTPSVGLLAQCLGACPLPIMVMIRPRAGGFCYSCAEFQTMLADAKAAVENGAYGLVFGCLHEDGTIDRERMGQLRDVAGDLDTVCHRAFDASPDPMAAMETLIELGMTRILTGGGRKAAEDGLEQLRAMTVAADGRIETMPGGSVRANNARMIADRVGCTSLHLGPFKKAVDPSAQANSEMNFGDHPVLDPAEARAVVDAISKAVGN